MNYLLLAIGILSATLIGLEVVFVRLLEIIQFTELSSLVVSLALLGFGYSGAYLFVVRNKSISDSENFIILNMICYCLSLLISFHLVQYLAFNPMGVLWDKWAVFYLLAEIFLLSLPFFFGSNVILKSLSLNKRSSHIIYGADLIGAGLGSIGSLAMISFSNPQYYLGVLLLFSICSCFLFCFCFSFKRIVYIKLALCFLPILFYAYSFEIKMSEYKPLSKQKLISSTRELAKISSAGGFFSVLENKKIPFRFAPGLSLLSREKIPEQLGVYKDGQGFFTLDKTVNINSSTKASYLFKTPQGAPYILKKNIKNKVLIDNPLGNQDIIRALSNKKNIIYLIHTNNQQDLLLQEKTTSRFLEPFYRSKNIVVVKDQLQHYLLSNPSSYFDIIELSYLKMSSLSQGSSLHVEPVLTSDSLKIIVSKLSEEGMLILSFWNEYPPNHLIRLKKILNLSGVKEKNILLIKSINTTSVVSKLNDFTKKEKEDIKVFCHDNVFECFAEFFDRDSLSTLSSKYGGGGDQKSKVYPFRVESVDNSQPFFFFFQEFPSFFHWAVSSSSMYHKHLDVGFLYLMLALIISVFLSFLILLPPLLEAKSLKNFLGFFKKNYLILCYFSFVGIGFMLFEITFIQVFTLILSHKTSSLAWVLCVFLVCAGMGSMSVERYDKKSGYKKIFLGILIFSIVNIFVFFCCYNFLMLLPNMLRLLFLLSMLSGLCYYLGMPFILGIKSFANQDTIISWAWSVNAFFSVIAGVLAKILSLYWGFFFVFSLALFCYLMSFFIFKRLV